MDVDKRGSPVYLYVGFFLDGYGRRYADTIHSSVNVIATLNTIRSVGVLENVTSLLDTLSTAW